MRPRALPLAGRLLAVIAGDGTQDMLDWRDDRREARQFASLVQGGLGPLLRWAAPGAGAVPRGLAETLLAADLTARVRHASLIETAVDVLDVCQALGVAAVFLKGISTGVQLYPAEHLRPMGDVDVLLPSADHAKVEAALLDAGFARLPYPAFAGHHHSAPLRHARRRTVVELHTALFPQSAPVHAAAVFETERLHRGSVPLIYHGRKAARLSNEVQLPYIAAAWFNDMTTSRFHPSFLVSLFDAVFLLKAHGRTLDWDGVSRSLGNEMVKASLYAMLTYVTRFGIEPPPRDVMRRLAANGGLVGPLQRRLIHAVLDRNLLGSRPWSLPWPPPMPGRYSPRHQLRKRLGLG